MRRTQSSFLCLKSMESHHAVYALWVAAACQHHQGACRRTQLTTLGVYLLTCPENEMRTLAIGTAKQCMTKLGKVEEWLRALGAATCDASRSCLGAYSEQPVHQSDSFPCPHVQHNLSFTGHMNRGQLGLGQGISARGGGLRVSIPPKNELKTTAS